MLRPVAGLVTDRIACYFGWRKAIQAQVEGADALGPLHHAPGNQEHDEDEQYSEGDDLETLETARQEVAADDEEDRAE